MNNLLIFIPLIPLIGFLFNGLGRNIFSKPIIATIGISSIALSFIASLLLFSSVYSIERIESNIYSLISTSTIKIEFSLLLDHLSALFILVITGVGLLIHIYSSSYMNNESNSNYARYFSYLNLFVFSMLILVLGANYLMMFIGWEGVGFCSYLLIGFWFKTDAYNEAAKKAFVMNRIGDVGFLLAMFYMLQKTGTIEFADFFSKLSTLSLIDKQNIALLLFIAATGKSAQLPLYTWLPDAMAGPTPVSALIHAATMVTAGIYMIVRSNLLFSQAPLVQNIIMIVGLATALLAASIALYQNDIKKVLAYSTVSQLGYMFIGLGVGSYSGALFHVITHAFFKALLFLGAGSVIHGMHHEQDIRKMGGLKKFMPITNITFLIGCLAISGIPLFSGFFSKDEILIAAFQKNQIVYALAVIGALMTSFYMFRLYSLVFLGDYRGGQENIGHHEHHDKHQIHESPGSMTFPLIVLAILSIIGGYIGIPEIFVKNANWLEKFLKPILETSLSLTSNEANISPSSEILLMSIVSVLVIITVFLSIKKFSKEKDFTKTNSSIANFLENKWYMDEFYNLIFVKPIQQIALLSKTFIEAIIVDGFVNIIGTSLNNLSRKVRLIQNGQVSYYLLIMVISTVTFFYFWFFDANIVKTFSNIF